jgi:hypothetical protein
VEYVDTIDGVDHVREAGRMAARVRAHRAPVTP